MAKKREQVGRIGLILTAAGSAVGLGNIWKFPTLAGQNGGGIFLLFYVFFIIVLGIPLLVGETTIGRYAQTDPTNAYKKIAKECGQTGWKLKFWTFVGFTGVVANFLILCYYSVIAGWILQYCIKVLFVPIGSMDMDMFQSSISSYVVPILCALAFIWITYAIDIKGVSKGLEKCAKYLMPALFIMLTVCAICNCTLDGAMEGVKFLFKPEFSKIDGLKGYGKIAFAALGIFIVVTNKVFSTNSFIHITNIGTVRLYSIKCPSRPICRNLVVNIEPFRHIRICIIGAGFKTGDSRFSSFCKTRWQFICYRQMRRYNIVCAVYNE